MCLGCVCTIIYIYWETSLGRTFYIFIAIVHVPTYTCAHSIALSLLYLNCYQFPYIYIFTDTKTHSKVSLTPQRRSFGSGCSWRESPIKAPPTNETEPEKDEVFHHNNHHYTTTPTTHHAPKVIDHIPYRSRGKGEWQETPPSRRRVNSWREAPPTKDSDDEPEWMSYGPSDPTEIMELKGIDEHELEKEGKFST